MHEVVLVSLLVFDLFWVAHATVRDAFVDEDGLMQAAFHLAAALRIFLAFHRVEAEVDALKKALKEF